MTARDRLNKINSGPGWFEVIHPTRATIFIATFTALLTAAVAVTLITTTWRLT